MTEKACSLVLVSIVLAFHRQIALLMKHPLEAVLGAEGGS